MAVEQSFDDTIVQKAALIVPPKVLLADDDDIAAEHLRATLQEAGFEVDAVSSGEEALARLSNDFVPIVILDRNMGGANGLEICKAIRQQKHPSYVYVILLTALDREEDILAGLHAGADDYLSKRSSTAQLIARLRTAQRILTLEQSLRDMASERRVLAMTDALTGAYNRRYFDKQGKRELDHLRRAGGELSLLLLDIDHFKRINDSYGHVVGDEVLARLTELIQGVLPRSTDWCARLGGEEFVVVLPQTPLKGASIVAERLRAIVATTKFNTSIGPLKVTVSIGVSSSEAKPTLPSIEDLVAHADKYLYEAKNEGRNRVKIAVRSPTREGLR